MARVSFFEMNVVTIAINDLFDFEGHAAPAVRPDDGTISAMVKRQFAFLPQPLDIEIGVSAVTVSFPSESKNAQTEASRLAERAAKRATEGDSAKAISLLKRVLDLQPSFHQARRDLAMNCMEVGNVESAKNHLIEVLRLNPGDAWSWVVLGNIYAKAEKDWPTAEKFFRRALEISPDDAWALNGLAAITAQRGQTDEAVKLFEQAIATNPGVPNPYYGLGVTFHRTDRPDLAARSLERLFANAQMQDARARHVFEQARTLYDVLQEELVKQEHPEAFKVVENLRAELEHLSGYPVRVTDVEFKDKTSAIIQMAWKHGRDHHLIKYRTGLPEDLRTHQMAHELTHLQLEAEARKAGRNRFFVTTNRTEQYALQRIEGDVRKLQRQGFPGDASQELGIALIRGLAGFLLNCPLDMLIETRLRVRMPLLSATQFIALRMGVRDALEPNTDPQVLEVTPKVILRAGLALNGAYCLFVDELYRGACNYAAHYQRLEAFPLSQRLFQHWRARSAQLGPGDEYALVDEFADMVGLRGWYEWQIDPGTHIVTGPPRKEGTTNPGLLRKKTVPAVYYCLDALKRYDKLPVETVREIAIEAGLVGRNGLDYASPDAKYSLKSLPDEKFTGLHLMCLMYAAFKRVAPEHDLQMDLHEPFLTALEMFQNGKSQTGD